MTGSRSGAPVSSGTGNATADREALDRLGAQIDAARHKLEPPRRHTASKYQSLTLAWRMVLELVIGCALGAGLGYGLDELFGTRPWLLILFGALGLAAGVKTMMASAHEIARQAEAQQMAASEGNGRGEQ